MVVIVDVKLDLAVALSPLPRGPVSRVYAHPAHPADFVIDHEAQRVGHGRLIGHRAQAVFTTDRDAFLNDGAQAGHELWVRAVHLQELLLRGLIVHKWVLLDKLYLKDGVSRVHVLVQLDSKFFYLLGRQLAAALYHVDVEVGREVVHMGAHRVACGIHAEEADHGLPHVFLLTCQAKKYIVRIIKQAYLLFVVLLTIHAVHIVALFCIVVAVDLHELDQV